MVRLCRLLGIAALWSRNEGPDSRFSRSCPARPRAASRCAKSNRLSMRLLHGHPGASCGTRICNGSPRWIVPHPRLLDSSHALSFSDPSSSDAYLRTNREAPEGGCHPFAAGARTGSNGAVHKIRWDAPVSLGPQDLEGLHSHRAALSLRGEVCD